MFAVGTVKCAGIITVLYGYVLPYGYVQRMLRCNSSPTKEQCAELVTRLGLACAYVTARLHS